MLRFRELSSGTPRKSSAVYRPEPDVAGDLHPEQADPAKPCGTRRWDPLSQGGRVDERDRRNHYRDNDGRATCRFHDSPCESRRASECQDRHSGVF